MKKSQAGFGHIIVILAVVVVAFVGFAAWRVLGDSNDKGSEEIRGNIGSKNKPTNESEADIVLHNLGLKSMDEVLIDQNGTREFESRGLKGFYVFGDKLEGGRINPNYEFASLKPGAKIIASIDGVITFIREQADSKDSEVFLQPKDGSVWTIGYDHLVNLNVTKGQAVKAGDVLGEPAAQNNGLTRFEIQINKGENDDTVHVCPSTLLAEGVKDKILGELKTMQDNWETTSGFELYDTTQQDPIGCLKKILIPAEAEGR